MARKLAWILVELGLSIAFALMILTAWQGLFLGSIEAGWGAGVRILFFFMDVGLVAFALWLIVRAVRDRRPLAGVGAIIGVVLNALAVLIIGFVQEGETPWAFLLDAATGGVAFLLGVVVATPIAHGLTRERD